MVCCRALPGPSLCHRSFLRELWHEVLGGEAQANCPPPFPMPPVQRLSLEPAPEPPLQPPPPPSTHAGAPSDEGMLAGKRSRALAIVDPVSLMPVAVEPKQSKALPIVDPVTEDEVCPQSLLHFGSVGPALLSAQVLICSPMSTGWGW